MKGTIVQEGDPVLRMVAKPVAKKDFGSPKLRAILKKMSAALAKEEFGVALAAPQVGESLRLFIVAGRVFRQGDDDDEEEDEQPVPPNMVFINPEIIRLSRKKREMSEGCLSVRGSYGTVLRHERASVRAYDEHGKLFTYNGVALLAHIFQHEIDHLDGILYIDKAEKLREGKERAQLREEYPA